MNRRGFLQAILAAAAAPAIVKASSLMKLAPVHSLVYKTEVWGFQRETVASTIDADGFMQFSAWVRPAGGIWTRKSMMVRSGENVGIRPNGELVALDGALPITKTDSDGGMLLGVPKGEMTIVGKRDGYVASTGQGLLVMGAGLQYELPGWSQA